MKLTTSFVPYLMCTKKNNKITNKVKQEKSWTVSTPWKIITIEKKLLDVLCDCHASSPVRYQHHQCSSFDRSPSNAHSLSVGVDCSAFALSTLCNRDRSISAHNLTHLSVLVCVIFFTSFSLLHPFSPADDDDDDDRAQCSRSFCSNAINLCWWDLMAVCLFVCSLWYSNLEHDFSVEMLFFALRPIVWHFCAHILNATWSSTPDNSI